MERRCETCRFWWLSHENNGMESGECRRSTPIARGDGPYGYWPMTLEDEWCGEWRETQEAEGLRLYEQIRATYELSGLKLGDDS